MGAHRYFYNKALDYNRETKEFSLIDIRNNILPKYKSLDMTHHEWWITQIPYDTCEYGIRQFLSNLKAAISNLKNKNVKHFTMDYITKKETGIFWIVKKAISIVNGNVRIFPTRLNNPYLKISKKGKRLLKKLQTIDSNVTIQKDNDEYYLNIFIKDKQNQYNKIPKQNNIIALDPGVRTFLTGYSSDEVVEYGNKISKRLEKIQLRINKKISAANTTKSSRLKKKILKRCSKLRAKIKGIVSDFHWKVAKHLTSNYSCILLPEYKTSKMTRKDSKLRKDSRKDILSLSNYKFKEIIKYVANNTPRCEVIICNESYTSKTCGSCGEINEKLGSLKHFKCKCGFNMDRDWNGARNVLIRSLTKYYQGKDTPSKDQSKD